MRLFLLTVSLLLGAVLFLWAENYSVEEMTLSVSHRIYKNFQEVHSVKMGERFFLSDGEYSAEATEFYPDFAINAETKEVISRSGEPNNPAVRVVVYKNDEKVDEVWAFGGDGSPHFYRDSLLAFQLVEYKGLSEVSTGEGEEAPVQDPPAKKGSGAKENTLVETKEDSSAVPSPGDMDP